MKKLFTLCVAFAALGVLLSPYSPARSAPEVPDTGIAEAAEEQSSLALTEVPEVLVPAEPQAPAPAYDPPVRLIVPSIGLDESIVNVGIDSLGRMDVPDGKTNTIGWYKYGTLPGHIGSAVLAAHVYAAFKKLHRVKPGADIYVVTKSGQTLHFIAEEAKLTKLEDVSPYFLFERSDARRLNLITCAGTFVRSIDTYDHRLIIYATLAE